MDYNEIEPGLYQGSRFTDLPPEINAIVNLRSMVPDNIDPSRVKAYAWFPIPDIQQWPGDNWLEMVVDTIANFRHNNLNVLVHCAAGISRASMVVCGYLIRHRGMTYQQAMDRIGQRRPVAHPNATFVEGLKGYSRKVRGSDG
jgi:protein-tyrosine phosphatase